VDPLTGSYPWYTPYQFAGNMPIWAIDLDGLEPAVIIGSEVQVKLVGQFNQNIDKSAQNWSAFQLKSLPQAKIDLVNHKALGNKIQVLLMQAHASKGHFTIFPGPDGIINTEGHAEGTGVITDDGRLESFHITDFYIPELKKINAMKSGKKKDAALAYFRNNEQVKKIDEFLDVVNEIENGGTLILNGCKIFNESEGLVFSNAIMEITGKRIHILGAQDLVRDAANPEKTEIFSAGFIKNAQKVKNGYLFDSEQTGKDLQLNGTGETLYELIPIEKNDEKQD
jgi:hypothetical protein